MVKENKIKDKFLLHVCCGPCSVAIFEELKKEFDLTVHFYNPNIYPESEYEKRKKEVIKLCQDLQIPFVEEEYNQKEWLELVRDFAGEPEGGKRCEVCFAMRLQKAGNYAKENDFLYFSTSLSSGRNKKAETINRLGQKIAEKNGLKFFAEDWKKKGRQEKANKMIKEKGIYRQDYCGCVYSLKSR